MESEDIEKVVAALNKVPEKKLLLIEIANKVKTVNGELDIVALAQIQPEVERAIAEAKEYSVQTSRAISALIAMGQREEED